MNSPADNRPSRQPRRAEPLQPDLPGRGTDRQAPAPPADSPTHSKDEAARQAEQSRDALDNVRKGYG